MKNQCPNPCDPVLKIDIFFHSQNLYVPCFSILGSRAAVANLNFRDGSTFPVPVCTVPSSMDRTNRCNKVGAVRLYASYRLNSLLLKGQICVG